MNLRTDPKDRHTITVHNRTIASMTPGEMRQEYDLISAKFAQAIREAGTDLDMTKVTILDGDTGAKSRMLVEMNARMDGLNAALRSTPTEARILPGEEGGGSAKSLGTLIADSKAFTKNGPEAVVPFEAKALMDTSSWVPESRRSGIVVPSAQTMPSAIEMFPVTPWDMQLYPYMEETTYSNGAVETAEGVAFGEATLALTEREEPMRKIPVFLPVTDEQLRYVPTARAYIDGRLTLMIRQRIEEQVLVGDGSAPNISGLLDRSGIQTQAKDTDPSFDAIMKAATKVRETGKAEPDSVILNPTAWQTIRLTRTADGIYIMGNPADGAGARGVFGLNVATQADMPSGTAVVGAFQQFSSLLVGGALEIKVSDSHSDYFFKGKQAIRAVAYVGLAIYRPAAFCQVSGL